MFAAAPFSAAPLASGEPRDRRILSVPFAWAPFAYPPPEHPPEAAGIAYAGDAAGLLPALSGASAGYTGWLGSGLQNLPALVGSVEGGFLFDPVGSASGELPAVWGAVAGSKVIDQPTPSSAEPPRYFCDLLLDGLPDYRVPISSLSVRYREDGSAYGRVVISGAMGHLDALRARLDGSVRITFAQGEIEEELIEFRVNFSRIDRGTSSVSVTLSGSAQMEARPALRFEVGGASYISESGGSVRLRISARGGIRPGDQIIYRGEQRTVTEAVWTVGVRDSRLEIVT